MFGVYLSGGGRLPSSDELYSCVIVAQGEGLWRGKPLMAGQGVLWSAEEEKGDLRLPSACIVLRFSERELLRVFGEHGIRADGVLFSLEGDWARTAEFFFERPQSVEKLARARATVELFLSYLREEEAVPSERAGESYVRFAESYIREHLGESIQVDAIAEELGISRGYLRNVFFAIHGMSPREYLTEERLRAAKALLREGGLSVGEIARQVGYEDVLQFSRIFKKHTGSSPSQYRVDHGVVAERMRTERVAVAPVTETAPEAPKTEEAPRRKAKDPVWLF